MTRTGAREVIRELAKLVLDGAAIDSQRFKEIIEALKRACGIAAANCFIPFVWRWPGVPAKENWIG